MAIKITAYDANNDGTGIDVTAYLNTFKSPTFSPDGFGYFSNDPADFSGRQYAVTEQPNLIPNTTKQAVVFDSGSGTSFSYNILTHVVTGALDAISYGYGVTWDKATDTFPLSQLDLQISGLGLSAGSSTVQALLNDGRTGSITNLTNLLAANEIYFMGSSGADVFTGYSKDDFIIGGAGDDILSGGGGNDTLFGGAGNDTLDGGPGNDIYVYDGRGTDTIAAGFVAGAASEDVIQITKGFTDFAGVFAAMSDVGGNAVIDFGGGNTLTITGVTKASLHEDDFTFGAFDDGIDDAPFAVNDSAATVKNVATVIDVLSNDSDDGTIDASTVTIVNGPAHGTLNVNETTGEITYTPTANYAGADSFTYTVKDNTGNVSNPATVTLDVGSTHILTSGDDVFSGDSLKLWSGGIWLEGGDGHDYLVTSNSKSFDDKVEGGDGNDLIFTGGGNDYVEGGDGDDVIHARGGTNTVIGGDGDDVYVFRFFANKSSGTTDTGTTTITDDDGVLWNGTYRPASYPGSWSPAPGATAGFEIGGTATYVSPGVFDLEVPDDNGGTQHLTLSWTGGDLTIVGGNQTVVIKDYVNGKFGLQLPPPVANDDTVSTVKSLSTKIDVLANDTDFDGTLDLTSVVIVNGPAHGTVSVNATTGVITYKSDVGYVGMDSFTYTVKDNDGQVSGEATVNLDVAAAHILTSGDDVFSGDSLQLWAEGTEVHGGDGHDYIVTSNSKSLPDKVYGGDGNDLIFTGGGDDYVEGGDGDDVIHARGGIDTVIGGDGDDVYVFRFFANKSSGTTDTGTTTITDDDGVLWNGTYRPATYPGSWSPAPGATAGFEINGTAAVVTPGTWDLEVADDNGGTQHLTLSWAGGDLTIVGGNQTVVIKDYVNGKFGITLENAEPVTSDDASSTLKNFARVIDVLSNDKDFDGTLDPSTVTILDGPDHGTVSINKTTGKITYTPTEGYTGADSFTYTVKDDDGVVSNTSTVTIDVQELFTLTDGDDVFSGDSMGWMSAGIAVSGGDGHDYIVTSNSKANPDTVYGGGGNDLIFTGGGNDYVEGGDGNDVIHARGGIDTVIGGDGDDVYVFRFFANKSSGTTDTGTTTITDDDGVLWNGTYRPASYPGSWSPAPGATAGFGINGSATYVSPGVFDLEVPDDNGGTQHLTLNWTGSGDLTIVGGNQTVVIKDYVNGKFGITIPTGPEVSVSGNGVGILDGDSAPDATDGTAFGLYAIGATAERSFTVANDGTAELKLSALKLPKGFKLAAGEKLPKSLAPGESVTLTVVLDTKKAGHYAGVISFKTNDADEALFDFAVSATVYGGSAAPQNPTGDAGDNTFAATADVEVFSGLEGNDTVSYAGATGPVVASLASPAKNTGFAAGDFYESIENLTGSAFNDTLTGDAGDNVLEGGAGADKLDGGAGIDTASYANAASGVTADLLKAANNTGEAAGDTYKNIENLTGSAFDDTLVGNNADNAIAGGAGADMLIGNGGIDVLTGGAGADTFMFNAIKDGGGVTKPSAKNMTGDVITDFVSGEDKIGILRSGFKIAQEVDLDAGGAFDFAAEYFVSGDGQADTPSGVAATKTGHGQFLFNEDTNQLWWDSDGAGKAAAVLLATFNTDIVAADFDLWSQNVKGDATDNVLVATGRAEAFFGFDGSDTASYQNGTAGVVANLASPAKNTGYAAGDTYFGIENLRGSAFDDTLTGDKFGNILEGGAGNDTLSGGAGDDILEGGAGADKLDGGAGIDTASYANAASGVRADLLKAANNTGEAAGDTYKNIENLTGSAFNDTLVGDKKANVLDGGAGDDMLIGGAGIDRLYGGAGVDTFMFDTPKDGGGATKATAKATGDLIMDFEAGVDKIGILRSAFGIEEAAGNLDPAYFLSGGTGVQANASGHGQFLFDTDASQLWWDADGAGKAKAVLLATFDNGAHLLATDFDLL
jgi:Ca2+-binding RTX toxin-like protein